MNKNVFRIIYNKRRGQLMAVAETSTSQGKGARGELFSSGQSATANKAAFGVGALGFAVLTVVGAVLWALPAPKADAQVVAYRHAPGNQQPTVLQTANGVPQVNIQTPSAAGVSRNVYGQFDVQSNGVILNNSRTHAQTQQGGWVQGNPWLATGSARVVLNEVNSSNPSYLNGYVEVAGQRAEVIIANPSGIRLNGGGFINTSKATLTTGTPIVNGGSLDGYRVQGGNISVNGNGLDLSTTDYAAMLARAVQVNAGIWANELKVVTGANQVDASSLGANASPVMSPMAGTGSVPTVALDVAQMGGMYAGKIHLIGTEQGLGVRSAGTIGSTGGDLVLQNNGWLTSAGTLQANKNLQISTQGNITNSGVIAAQGNISIAASGLSSTAASVVGAGIKTDGTLVSSGNLTIATTEGLSAHGQNLAAGNITLTGSRIDLSGSQTGAANIAIVANSGNVNTANATLATSGTAGVLAINAKTNADQTLDNTHGVMSAGQLNLDVANLTNAKGQIMQTGVGNTSIALTSPISNFNNTGGTVIVNSANLGVTATSLNNTDGLIQTTAGSLDVNVGNLDNTQGSVHAHTDLSLISAGAIANSGSIAAKGNATLSANSLSSSSTSVLGAGIKADGTLANSGDLKITTTQALNANGQNLAAGSTTLSGGSTNLSGSQTGGANIGITATSGDVNTSNATVATAGTLHIEAKASNGQTLNNTQGVLSAGQLNVDVSNIINTQGQAIQTGVGDTSIVLTSPTGTLDNKNGTIASNSANLHLSADTLTNTGGKIQHAGMGTLHVVANRLNNIEGAIVQIGNGPMAVSVSQRLDNTAGTLASNGNLTVAAQSLTNNQGQVSALGDLTTNLNTTSGVFSNLQGLVAVKGNVTITAASVDNTRGTLASVEKNLSVITTGETANDSGKIQAALDITLNNAGLSNTRTTNALATSDTPYGSIIARNVDINTHTQTLNNAGGTIAASQTANFQTGALHNNGGLVQTGSDLTIHTHDQTLTNTHAANHTSSNTALNGKGGIASQGLTTLTTGDLNNDAGYIGSKGAMTANSANISNTQSGQIQSLGDLSLTAGNGSDTGAIDNTGGLIRGAATTILSAGTVTNSNTSGTGLGIEGLDVGVSTTSLRNDSGAMRADHNITVTSGGMVNNSAGLMSAGNTLTMQDMQAQTSRTLAITNTNGTQLAGQSLVVAANRIGGDGSILSKGSLNLALNTDFSNSGHVIANGNATVHNTGNVSNSGKLQAGNTLNLTAYNIDNTVAGEISANTTQVNANSNLNNRGLIDGVDTRVNADTVGNMGTGRMYGDQLSIAAVSLTNNTETIGGVTKAGTIAARDRLDLGVSGTLTNREHALIYSVGEMAIGGALDANRRATGSATTLNNNSATIEAGRNLSLSSTTLNNTNDHFAYEIRVATTELDVREDIDPRLYRLFTRTTYLPYQTASDPAQILAGGDINLNSSKPTNYASHVVAGGALNVSASALANTGVMATKSVHDAGETYTLVHVPQSGYCGKVSYNCVRAHDKWQAAPYDSTANSTVPVAQETAASHRSVQVSRLVSGSMNQTLEAVGNVDAQSGNIAQDNVSVKQLGATPVNKPKGASTPSSTNAGLTKTQVLSVRGVQANTTLPTNRLFKTNPSIDSAYLIETDARFADKKRWLGSDYMTLSLSLDPTVTQKRLGDGFYEQKLIREQVAELTGRRFLADYTSDEQEYKALMTSAITFGQKYNLRPGIALTAQQIAQLTSDIVWLVEQTVSLPDGSSQKVLVPQVYVKVQPGDLDGSGALLAGKDVNLNLSGDLTNSGTIAGRSLVNLTAENVNNLGGRIGGNDVSVAARQDLKNIGGSIGAVNSLSATAGRDLNIQTTTQSTNTHVGSANFSRTGIDRVAGLYVSGANGTLVASAGRDLNIVAGVVSNAGNGATSLSAGNNFTLASVKKREQNNIVWDPDNHLNYGNTQTVGSTINGGGNVNLKAGNDLTATAANVKSAQALDMQAGGNVNVFAGENTSSIDEAHRVAHRGFFGSSTATTKNVNSVSTGVGSESNGESINIVAGGSVAVKASELTAVNTIAINAIRDISVESGRNTQSIKPAEFEIQKSRVNGGAVLLKAGNDITLTTAELRGSGIANSSTPSTAVVAGGNLNISSEQTSRKTVTGGVTTQSLLTQRSNISGENGLILYGGKRIDVSAVDLNSANGGVSVVSKGDITLGYNTDTVQKNWTTSSTSRSWYGKKTTTVTQHETIDKTASATALNGQSIEVLGQNVLSEGAQIGAANAIRVEGADQTRLYAVQNQSIKTENSQRSSSWFGIGLGSKTQNDISFNSQALGTRLESQQAIQIGVGSKTDLSGADLQAPTIAFTRVNGADTSKPGELVLGASVNSTQTSHTETTTTAGVWQKQAGNGSTNQTLNQTQLKGQTTFDPTLSISVQLPEGNLKTQVQKLSNQAGVTYINDLAKRNDVNWKQVSLVHDQWNYSQQGLTAPGAALLTIAVMAATGGMGAELAGTTSTATTAGVATTKTTMAGATLATTVGATTAYTAAGAALNAGFSALAAQASVSLANNGGDIGKTLKDLGSSKTVKNTLVAMATASVGTSVAGQGVSAVAAQTAAGCATGALTGAGCEQGAKTAAVLSTAGETYQSLVGYAANAGPGENRNGTRLDGTSTGNASYEPVRTGPNFGQQQAVDRGMNVIGFNSPGSVGSQGGTLSRALNQVPTINATAGLHDYVFNANLLEQTTFVNIWTMPASAVVAVPAALNNPNISWMTQIGQPDSIKHATVPSVIRIDANTSSQKSFSSGEQK